MPVTPEVDSVDIYLRCAAHAQEMLAEILADLEGAWSRGVPQGERMPYWRRPDRQLLTLDHGLTRAQAEQIFRSYNSMTQVALDGRWHYVTALLPGSTPLPVGTWQLAEDRWLYRVADGHLHFSKFSNCTFSAKKVIKTTIFTILYNKIFVLYYAQKGGECHESR